MNNDDKTQIFGYSGASGTNNQNDRTQHLSNKSNSNSDKTEIFGGSQKSASSQQNKRRLVGWLVSYTLDEAGTDFRLFEGKNKLGREMTNDLRIFQDPKISSEHATLLCREGKFYAKDELASNASFLNNNEIKPGETIEFVDGDVLKFGDNEFIFRKAQK